MDLISDANRVAGCIINMERNSLFQESSFIFPLPYPLSTRTIERSLLDYILIIKPAKSTNFSNLFWNKTLHLMCG